MLLAAVVGFGIPAASGGAGGAGGSMLVPWCLAFLAGPLDVLHWRQRSFARMAYNAGNRMTATLLAAVAFSAVLGRDPAPSFAVLAVGALAASAAFAFAEVVVGTALVRLRTGTAWGAAARVSPVGAAQESVERMSASTTAAAAPGRCSATSAACRAAMIAR